MANMLRRSHIRRWLCKCCSIDPPTRFYGGGKSFARERRMVKRTAKRREAKLWRSEMGDG